MGLSSLKSLSIVTVVLLSFANANMYNFGSLVNDFQKLENGVKDRLGLLDKDVVRSWTRLSPAVKKMAINAPFSLISPHLNKQKMPSKLKIKSSGFSWLSCGPADQLVEIRNLTVLPSPLSLPGTLSFGFDIFFHDTIKSDAQVSADLLLQYSSGGQTWIKIPCIGNIGSCTYEDVCSLSQAIQCPDELKKRGIPCTCPIYKGEYNLPIFSVEVDASVFLPGDYQGIVTFAEMSIGQIACYQVYFSVV